MFFSNSSTRKLLAALLLAGAPGIATGLVTGPAQAEPANDVKCRGCVGKKDIGKKAVRPKHIKKMAIKSKHLREGAVTDDKLSDTAKPTGVEFDEAVGFQSLENALQVILSTEVTAPGPGYVTVMTTWYFAGNNDGNDYGYCYVGPDPTVITDVPFIFSDSGANTSFRDPAALVRTFEVEQGKTTFHLYCSDTGTDMSVVNPTIAAIFTPNHY